MIVNPPKKDAEASSKAPVIVTPASRDASIPMFIISISVNGSRQNSLATKAAVAITTALDKALLEESPEPKGKLDFVLTSIPSPFPKSKLGMISSKSNALPIL